VESHEAVKTTGVGGEERGYDGGKKVKGRKRHLLVDTESLMLKVKVHSATVMDRDGIEPLLKRGEGQFPRLLKYLWLDAGYKSKAKKWVEKALGWLVEVVQHPPPKIASQEMLRTWAREWAKEGVTIDWEKPLPPRDFRVLPRRWVVERTFFRGWNRTVG
jgi:putative transposase